MKHGTVSGYTNGRCRCDECRRAMNAYQRNRNATDIVDRDLLSDLLNELFPYGLTPECPVQRALSATDGTIRR